jgi:hypothetical protein
VPARVDLALDGGEDGAGARGELLRRHRLGLAVNPLWIWTQVAIVAFVVAGMVIAIIRLV